MKYQNNFETGILHIAVHSVLQWNVFTFWELVQLTVEVCEVESHGIVSSNWPVVPLPGDGRVDWEGKESWSARRKSGASATLCTRALLWQAGNSTWAVAFPSVELTKLEAELFMIGYVKIFLAQARLVLPSLSPTIYLRSILISSSLGTCVFQLVSLYSLIWSHL